MQMSVALDILQRFSCQPRRKCPETDPDSVPRVWSVKTQLSGLSLFQSSCLKTAQVILTADLSPVCMCMCTWSAWAPRPGSAGSRGPVPRRAPPVCGCRRPRWCSCPVAPSTRSLMPCCPGAPGAQSLTWSADTHTVFPFKDYFCTEFVERVTDKDDAETGS